MVRRLLTTGMAVSLLLAGTVRPAFGIDPIPGTPIPPESRTRLLTESATAALPFDLDGDSVRELVVVTAAADAARFAAVQAFWVDANGNVTASSRINLRRSASGRVESDEGGMTRVMAREPARLLTVLRDGSPVALAAVTGLGVGSTSTCCLTVWEVQPDRGEGIALELMAESDEVGFQMAAADLDADGTDELIVLDTSTTAEDGIRLGVFSWDGSRYVRTTAEYTGAGCCSTILDVGDSDGRPGDDILLSYSGQEFDGGLIRLTLRAGTVAFESQAVSSGFGPPTVVRVFQQASGPAIVTSDGFQYVLSTWGRDQPIEALGGDSRFGSPLAVVGSGARAWLLLGTWPEPQNVTAVSFDEEPGADFMTFGADLRASALASVANAAGGFSGGTFAGLVPGGLPGGTAGFVFGGHVVVPAADPDLPLARQSIATLPGLAPAGSVGPDAAWMAIGSIESLAPPGPPGLPPDFFGALPPPNVRTPDLTAANVPGPISIAAVADVLESEVDNGVLNPTFFGLAPEPGQSRNLVVGSEAAEVEIAGPQGTVIRWATRRNSVGGPIVGPGGGGEVSIGPGGVARIRLLDPMDPGLSDGGIAVASVWLVTPAGHAYRGTWLIRVDREPPSLTIEQGVPLLDFAPRVTGRTLPGTVVTVNGVPGAVDPDGTFSVPVNVGLLPTEVRIVVADALGNQTQQVVSRSWPLDYRQLPWIPVAVVLTGLVGFFLFMRGAIGTAPRRPTSPDEDSPFEEIGG